MARATAPAAAATLVHTLRQRAQRTPTERAYTFLLDGEQEELHLTFAELDAGARQGAALLQEIGAVGRALLLYAPGPDYVTGFFACLYAGVVAVPAYPPRPGRRDHRIAAIIRDCEPACVLTQSWIRAQRDMLVAETPALGGRPWLAFDADVSPGGEDAWHDPAVRDNTIAFLQYTSGSTAAPKGVMISHGNLITNVAATYAAFGYGPEAVGVSWLPPYHDMGLIGAVLPPVCSGFPVVMMSPIAFLQRPARWLEALSRYRGTASGGPSSAYQLCIDRVTDEEAAGLDLGCWVRAMNGAEPIRARVLDRFSERFAVCGFRREAFYPCYGLAEATLLVAGGRRTRDPSRRLVDREALRDGRLETARPGDPGPQVLVASGLPGPGVTVKIVDPDTCEPCTTAVVGEVWVAGPGVARGYWRRPEASRETFGFRLRGHGETPFLRTGDLGVISDGVLFVTGRRSDMIIVRGRNHYPQDIEATVEQCDPALAPNRCAAFQIEVAEEERLVIVHELREAARARAPEIVIAIRQAVAQEHELEVHAVALITRRTLPRTSSGKIQRRPCCQAFLDGTLAIVHEWREPFDTGAPRRRSELDTDALSWPPPRRSATRTTTPPDNAGAAAAGTTTPARDTLVSELLELAPDRRHEWLRGRLTEQLTAVLALDPRDGIDPRRPLAELGLTSLTAVELSNMVTRSTAVHLPVTALFDHPTLEALATFILNELFADSENDSASTVIATPGRVSLAAIEQLSDEEAEALLDSSVTALLGRGSDD